jgi:hypothetical protein
MDAADDPPAKFICGLDLKAVPVGHRKKALKWLKRKKYQNAMTL